MRVRSTRSRRDRQLGIALGIESIVCGIATGVSIFGILVCLFVLFTS